MNVELLRRVQAHILEEPRRLNMDHWIRTGQTGPDSPACGTTACIAGWALELDGKDPSLLFADVDAAKTLGITPMQGERLFFVGSWPSSFVTRYDDASHDNVRAVVASERIDHFIATKGRE